MKIVDSWLVSVCCFMGDTDECLSFFSFFLAKPFDPTFFLSCTVSNVICCLVFGQRFSYDDKHFLYLLQIISDTLKFGSSSQGQVKAKVTITWNWHGGWVIQLKTKCAQIIARVQQHCNTAIESFFCFSHHSSIISSHGWWSGCQVHITMCLPNLRRWEHLLWIKSKNVRTHWTQVHPEITLTASS